jgi:hypothetical protein
MLPFSAPFAENIGDIRRISKIYLRMFSGELCQHTETNWVLSPTLNGTKLPFSQTVLRPRRWGSPAIAG